jgi:hypothetical protein
MDKYNFKIKTEVKTDLICSIDFNGATEDLEKEILTNISSLAFERGYNISVEDLNNMKVKLFRGLSCEVFPISPDKEVYAHIKLDEYNFLEEVVFTFVTLMSSVDITKD